MECQDCAQPNDGILIPPRTPYQNLVGLGNPTENPLYVNIVCPPGWSPGSDRKYPVKIYIHGGFLQLGSPHELNSQAEYIAKESETVHVNIGYRVSAFGFLASDEPRLDGNFGFKDQWLGLLWVRDNIECFGGDPTNIQLTGLSAGAHSVHQILHHVSRLPEGEKSPFQSATLQSNGMMANPATPAGQRPQFDALCHSLGLDPRSPTILSQLRDTSALPFNKITQVIESGEIGTEFDTFRGTRDSTWTGDSPDPMTWQRSGEFARALKAKGVRSVVVGDLTEEWFIYAMTHPVYSYADVEANLRKFYPRDVVARLLECYETEPQNLFRFMGKVLSDCQVYLPTRLLARDLYNAGFPVLRYEIGWVPQAVYSSIGYVTHGLDRTIWADRQTLISQPEHLVVLAWLDAIDAQRKAVEEGTSTDAQDIKRVFALKKDMSMGWKDDARWDEVKGLIAALPGEN
ncbi:hypothetical protein EVJ58_g4960 [Rhodofomes roseus]|uniref:Carboxylic ester hydrolase n=1 Tax=Rhodofomes roseus TaxID=34475 RepID=A0A4Y9YIF0_9APHY|nr:hypothetical protein EVJ58_g4960 [Rhodofomes roseus]